MYVCILYMRVNKYTYVQKVHLYEHELCIHSKKIAYTYISSQVVCVHTLLSNTIPFCALSNNPLLLVSSIVNSLVVTWSTARLNTPRDTLWPSTELNSGPSP